MVPGFIHELMLEGSGVGVEGVGFYAEFLAGLAPSGDCGEPLAESRIGLGNIEIEARRRSERRADGRILLVLRDGGLWGLRAVDFRHRIEVVGGRECPPPGLAHEETVIA